MNGNLIVVLTVIASALAIAAVAELAVIAKAKKWNLTGIIQKATDTYGTAATIAAALEPFLPAPFSGIVKLIFTYADKITKAIEHAAQAGTCPEDQRKAQAVAMMENALAMEGITADDKVKALIDVAVETMVKTLPKTHTNSKVAGTVAAATK